MERLTESQLSELKHSPTSLTLPKILIIISSNSYYLIPVTCLFVCLLLTDIRLCSFHCKLSRFRKSHATRGSFALGSFSGVKWPQPLKWNSSCDRDCGTSCSALRQCLQKAQQNTVKLASVIIFWRASPKDWIPKVSPQTSLHICCLEVISAVDVDKVAAWLLKWGWRCLPSTEASWNNLWKFIV